MSYYNIFIPNIYIYRYFGILFLFNFALREIHIIYVK